MKRFIDVLIVFCIIAPPVALGVGLAREICGIGQKETASAAKVEELEHRVKSLERSFSNAVRMIIDLKIWQQKRDEPIECEAGPAIPDPAMPEFPAAPRAWRG